MGVHGAVRQWRVLEGLLRACRLDGGPDEVARWSTEFWPQAVEGARTLRLLPQLASVAVRGRVLPELPDGLGPGVLAQRAGLSWQGVLWQARCRNRERNRLLLEQGEEVLAALAAAGVRAAGLKGLHLLRAGSWPDPAAREMRDLDVLVAPADLDAAREVLAELHYRPATADGYGRLADDHHDLALSRPGAPGTVELHRALLARDHARELDTAAVLERITPDGFLDDADAFLHVVAHAQLQDAGRLMAQPPLRAVLDGAWLLRAGRAGTAPQHRARSGPALRRALAVHLRDTAVVAGWPDSAAAHGGWWWRMRWLAGLAVASSPRWAPLYQDVCLAPRTLNASRIAQLYDVPAHGVPLARARAAYVGRALARRR
ncbi:nucleotidyltransferase family protein [Kitasatospora phosalacinea]|uniref:Nucleotidyltransferase family protein n=1 Tax=Kitasatospora phosalacinea TaxID=2065 RepID=A0ABW6GM08_9ACTN